MDFIDGIAVADSSYCDLDGCAPPGLNLKNNLKVISQNIRSINKNIDEFEILLTRTRVEWDLVILTECWIKGVNNIPSLTGYDSYMSKNNKSQNEGVVVYTNKNISVIVEEPPLADCNCLQITLNQNTTVLAIYRSPASKNISPFLNSLNDVLVKVSRANNIVIIGDLNINISDSSQDPNKNDYLTLLASFAFVRIRLLPAHTLPTRQSNCLDHVMLKTKLPAKALVAHTAITDHQTVILYLSKFTPKPVTVRTINRLNYEKISLDLSKLDFTPIYNTQDPNFAADFFVNSIKLVIESNTKIIKLSNRKRLIKPWVTPGLLRCLKYRDKMHKNLKKHPNDKILATSYSRYRNYCTKILRQLKNEYNKNEIIASRNNTKSLWQTINKITLRSTCKTGATNLLSLAPSPDQAVNVINDFFVNTGKILAEKIQPSPPITPSTIKSSCHSMVLLPTDEQEVMKVAVSLRSDCAMGWDNISPRIIKQNIHVIVPPLTHICNLSLATGLFPKTFKKAIIHPIYKAGNRDQVTNYRPIAVLPSLSKILERIINKRLTAYLENNNILSTSQYGFRAGRSTGDAVHALTDHIVKKLDEGQKVLGIFLDMAKAFDTVSVAVLIEKMERMGIRGTQLKLLTDFLSDRTQTVKVDKYLSKELPTTHGIPQGSVISPTLFLIYINDLCTLNLQNGKIFTFADDTALLFHSDTWTNVYDCAQKGFNIVSDWLRSNILTLNSEKTKYIPFAIRCTPPASTTLLITAHTCPRPHNLECRCKPLGRTSSTKYLGVILDPSLSFHPHIEALTSRIRKMIYIFKNLKDVADESIRKMVYYTLCQSLLTYCITTWGGTHKTTLLRLERAQRAILKVSYNLPFRYPTEELYKKSKVLTVRQLFILHTVLKQHSLLSYSPTSLQDKRRFNPSNVFKHHFHTRFTNRFFYFIGGNIYNKINKTKEIYPLTKLACKNRLTEWLLTLNYETTENLIKIPD